MKPLAFRRRELCRLSMAAVQKRLDRGDAPLTGNQQASDRDVAFWLRYLGDGSMINVKADVVARMAHDLAMARQEGRK